MILAGIGFTPSDVFMMLICRTVAEGGLPFEPLVQSTETLPRLQSTAPGSWLHASRCAP